MKYTKWFSNLTIINFLILIFFLLRVSFSFAQNPLILTGPEPENDISHLLKLNGLAYHYEPSVEQAIEVAKKNSGIFVFSNSSSGIKILTKRNLKKIRNKNLKLFLEFPENLPLIEFQPEKLTIQKERGVIVGNRIEGTCAMDIISLNTEKLLVLQDPNEIPKEDLLAVIGKVAGFDSAEYGIEDITSYPLLFHFENHYLISTAVFSTALTARYGPTQKWKKVFEYIFGWLYDQPVSLKKYPVSVKPTYMEKQILPENAISQAIIRGSDWFFKAKLLVHPTWEQLYYENTAKNGKEVVHPPVADSVPIGNGSLGILEGQASQINSDGSQPYRWWIRADCQAETAYALSTAYKYSPNEKYRETAKNLLDYLFETSNLRAGKRNDPESPSFGLIGWATTDPDAYYGDDNARLLLSLIGASTNLDLHDWDKKLLEGIIANFRTAGTKGFRGPWFRDAEMQKTTWQALGQREIVNVHPHYEAWLWSLYIWLYDKTGEEAFYEKAESAIRITMETYPNWKWTNGITQEYARMILPLAWLIRVKDTPKHRDWLNLVVNQLLKGFEDNGAITERLGTPGLGRYEKIKSNAEYGTKEAPLISSEDDKVADLLYTMNFSLFSLNEAAQATGNKKYAAAADKIAKFLVKIQIDAEGHEDLDGAWFRAFDVDGWEYWASNADSDWGPWGTLTGWTQSWIINGLANEQKGKSLWESSHKHYSTAKFRALSKKKIEQMLTNKLTN